MLSLVSRVCVCVLVCLFVRASVFVREQGGQALLPLARVLMSFIIVLTIELLSGRPFCFAHGDAGLLIGAAPSCRLALWMVVGVGVE